MKDPSGLALNFAEVLSRRGLWILLISVVWAVLPFWFRLRPLTRECSGLAGQRGPHRRARVFVPL